MSNLRQAAQQALEFCEFLWREVGLNDYAEEKREETELALRAALSKPAQRPVYWEVRCKAHPKWMRVDEQQFDEYVTHGWDGQKLYTSPQRSEPEALAQEPSELKAQLERTQQRRQK